MSYKKLLHDINTFIFDVDGVLTDGKLLLTENGELLRSMSAKDGYAIKTALDHGYNVCIITGGRNKAVKSRLEKLGIEHVYLNIQDKNATLSEYMIAHDLKYNQIAYMGDDLPDAMVIQKVGLGCCPQDAVPEIKAISDYISHKNGGNGCVRDLIEQVMKVHGKWMQL